MLRILHLENGININEHYYPRNSLVFSILGKKVEISLATNNDKLFSANYTEFIDSSGQTYLSPEAVVEDLLANNIANNTSRTTVVNNYSALPDPTTVADRFYWCDNSQGTRWLPGSLGGTYYNAGLYYSNGVSWSFMEVPYQATQLETNAGVVDDRFITPSTLKNSSQWYEPKLSKFIAGETLGGQRVVMLKNGKAFYFDQIDENNIGYSLGMTNQAANQDDLIDIATSGVVIDNGWGLIPDTIYYLGTNGLITNLIPSSGVFQRVGVAVDSNTLKLEFSEPISIS